MEILIVEDHPVVAEGLQKLLTESKTAKMVPAVQSGEECLRVLEHFSPDILFLDINLPDISGIDLCKKILARWPGIHIIALSSYSSKTVIRKMLDSGAGAYLTKDADSSEILAAISSVMKGESYCNQQVKAILSDSARESLPLLSARELEVLRLIAEGYTNNEIAEKIFISPLTVDSHRKNMLLKLGARNTAALVRLATLNGLI